MFSLSVSLSWCISTSFEFVTDATGTVSVLVYSLVIGVLCVFLYVLVFAYVGGCGSCCLPNVCQILFLFHFRCYETPKEVKSQISLLLTHMFAVSFSSSLSQQLWDTDMRVPNSSGYDPEGWRLSCCLIQIKQICYDIKQQKCLQCLSFGMI